MEEDIFIECGSYGPQLSEIAKNVVTQRRENGEIITEKDIRDIESNVFEAYQRILSNAKDKKTISEAVNDLANLIERKGDISNIVEQADQIAKRVVLDDIIEKESAQTKSGTVVQATAVVVTAAELSKNDNESILDKLFNKELQEKINSDYKDASEGNIEAVANVNEIELMTDFLNSHKELDDKSKRALLARMMRLAALKTEQGTKVLGEVAKTCGFDIFSENENGESSVDLQKLQQLYSEEVGKVNPKAAQRTIEDFAEMIKKSASREIERGTYSKPGRTLQIGLLEREERRKLTELERKINIAYRDENLIEVQELIRENPDQAKLIIQNLFQLQQLPNLSASKANDLKDKGIILGEMLSEVKKEEQERTEISAITAQVKLFNENKNANNTQDIDDSHDER